MFSDDSFRWLRPRRAQAAPALALVAAAAIAVGCGGSSSSGSTTSGTPEAGSSSGDPTTLRVASAIAPGTLDPGAVTQVQDCMISPAYVTLTRVGSSAGPDGIQVKDASKIEPYLAESWEISEDGKVYDFKLKEGLKFPSGEPTDAAAVKYSLERTLKGPLGPSFLTNNIPGNVKAFDVVDPYHLRITLGQPDPVLLQALAGCFAGVIDRTVVEANDEDWLATHEAGSGPFEIAEYKPNVSLKFKKRAGYEEWGEAPPSENINIDFIADPSALLLRAQSGDADVVLGLLKSNAAAVKNMKVVGIQVPKVVRVVLPWSKKPFDSVKVREALIRAVPYDEIVKNVASDYATRFFGPIYPGMQYYDETASAPIETDAEAAKAAMDAAGVKTPVDVELNILQGAANDARLATLLQAAWKPLGIDLKITQLPAAQFSTAIFGHKFQAAIRSGGPALYDPSYLLGYSIQCDIPGQGINPSDICDPRMDELVAQARTTTDAAEAQSIYNQIVEIWRSHWSEVTLYGEVDVLAVSDAVKSTWYGTSLDFTLWGK